MDEWKETTLSEVTSILGDGLHGTPIYDETGEYFFINGNNLNNGKILIKENTKKANADEYEKYKKDLNDRTIFVSINGTLGNIALYNGEKCILGKSACWTKPLRGRQTPYIHLCGEYLVAAYIFCNNSITAMQVHCHYPIITQRRLQ
ncbi:MAG: restriction endonuclease subunit S [Candidatus Electrothrix communis]|nr:MAG: restriction endonuclease subunit S [Candidatus Electrothrix communis]